MNTEELLQQLVEVISTYGLSVIGAIIILIIGFMVAGWVKRVILRGGEKSKRLDPALTRFFASLARYAVIVFVLLAVLDQFGVETTSFIAVLGALGLAIGLSLQGTLSHLASGVMLLLFRPFKLGDYVIVGGEGGTVKEIGLFTTELATPDNVQKLIPNGQVWGDTITNYSAHDTRRVDFELGIGYGDDIDKAIEVIKDVISGESRCMDEPAPQIVVGTLADSSVNIIVRVWAQAADYWGVKFDLTKQFKEKFDANGIEIPFPQRTVHMVSESAD